MKNFRGLFFAVLFFAVSFPAFALSVHFSPNPENEKVLADYLESAEETLDIAAYSITLPSFADNLIAAKKRGVVIRILWDKSQSAIKSSLLNKIRRAGIPVKTVHFKGIMHNKYIIVDRKSVETGSFNFTGNATFRNNENFLIIPDAEIAKEYQDDFDKMWSHE